VLGAVNTNVTVTVPLNPVLDWLTVTDGLDTLVPLDVDEL